GRAVSLGPGAAGGAASPARCLLRLPLRPLEEGAALHPRSQGRHGRGLPVRDEARNAIIDDPPHILLANYVMLEYMLIRPAERTLIGLTTRELAFLVMDELHVYRGRQGADVAMLLRRVGQRAGQRE